MAQYNGHKNWTYWNVSLWINNDEGLYTLAKECVKNSKTRRDAATRFVEAMHEVGQPRTPDGAPYSATTVAAAMKEM